MIILTQASDGGSWISLALFIAIGLVALAAWGTHWIWYFRSFGMSAIRGNVVLNARYFLGVIGLVVPIVGIIHGVAIWVGKGKSARVVDWTGMIVICIVLGPMVLFLLIFVALGIFCLGHTC